MARRVQSTHEVVVDAFSLGQRLWRLGEVLSAGMLHLIPGLLVGQEPMALSLRVAVRLLRLLLSW
ncbi:MAG: hypothetical protein NZ869_06095 [Thermoanaerobaculum sp.]|nr:hypothetical protein [Thermoanaerobaculum sp.]MDW7968256.1 hypothetical protein [Thermoanaerobaculum sp.]